MGQQRWVRDHSQEASQGTPFLKGSSERPALEFTTRGSPPLQALNSGRRQLGALSTGAAPAGEARGQPSRCPPRPNTQRGHSAAATGSSPGHSPLPPPDGRTVGFCQTAQDARRPPPSPAQAPSVAQASWFSVSLPTEDQLEKAAQDVPMASTLASHPAPSPSPRKHPHAAAALTPAPARCAGGSPTAARKTALRSLHGAQFSSVVPGGDGGEAKAQGKDAWQPVVRPSSWSFQGTFSWVHLPLGTPSVPRSSLLPSYSALYRHF